MQHFDEPGLVERRIGVGRAGEAGDAARRRGLHLRFQGRLVFETRFAQARGEIDEARDIRSARGVDRAVGAPFARRVADAAILPAAM